MLTALRLQVEGRKVRLNSAPLHNVARHEGSLMMSFPRHALSAGPNEFRFTMTSDTVRLPDYSVQQVSWQNTVPPKRRLTYRLDGTLYQKMATFASDIASPGRCYWVSVYIT
jgi:hypothetical protein